MSVENQRSEKDHRKCLTLILNLMNTLFLSSTKLSLWTTDNHTCYDFNKFW
jgi:hypothetical protein